MTFISGQFHRRYFSHQSIKLAWKIQFKSPRSQELTRWVWMTHICWNIINFDALAQASDFRIERRQVVFLCWMQDSNPGSQKPNFWNKLQWNFDWILNIFIKENAFQNVVCKMASILSGPQYVKSWLWMGPTSSPSPVPFPVTLPWQEHFKGWLW